MPDYTLKWDDAAFKKQVIANLTANGEIVGKFVETDARKRLNAIQNPAWGKKYRQLIVGRLLTYQIEVKSSEVTILVGVAKSRDGKHHGFYIELGSLTAPPNPFLRPAVFMNAKQIVALLEGK